MGFWHLLTYQHLLLAKVKGCLFQSGPGILCSGSNCSLQKVKECL